MGRHGHGPAWAAWYVVWRWRMADSSLIGSTCCTAVHPYPCAYQLTILFVILDLDIYKYREQHSCSCAGVLIFI
jgi:hypothetical protein